jgi:hypothetical protein
MELRETTEFKEQRRYKLDVKSLSLMAYTNRLNYLRKPRQITVLQVIVNVKVTLWLTKHHAKKTYWGVEV